MEHPIMKRTQAWIWLPALLLLAGCGQEDAPLGAQEATLVTASGGGWNETAFAYDCENETRSCFLDLDLDGNDRPDFSRWGWSNGPYEDGLLVLDLYAAAGRCDIDNGTLVGQVELEIAGGVAWARYRTCGDYWLEEVHLHLGEQPVPYRRNRPTVAPGQFEHKASGLNTQEHVFGPIAVQGPVFLVAHAVVRASAWAGDCGERGCQPPCVPVFDADGLQELLDAAGEATIRVFGHYEGGPAYFPQVEVVAAPGSPLSGLWPGWCIDLDHEITTWGPILQPWYLASAYSSYAEAAIIGGLFEIPAAELPGALARVNWMLNQGFVGQPATCGGIFTYADLQQAIWELVEDDLSGSSFNPYEPCRVAELLGASQDHGSFVPACDGIVAVILDPRTSNGLQRQVLIVEIPAPCTDCD
jgi:hypothetical protein